MCREEIMEGFSPDSDYTRFLRMQALHKVLNIPEHGSKMPHGKVLNMPGQFFTGF